MKKLVPNTVMGHPELVFRTAWIEVLRKAMAKTGRGYKRYCLRHTGKQSKVDGSWDRRADKIGTTKLERRMARLAVPALRRGNFPETA